MTDGVGLDDLGDAFLAGAVRARDQHRNVGARDLAGELDDALGRRRRENESAQIVLRIERLAALAALLAHARDLARRLGKLEKILDRREQLVVVPRFGEIVGRAGLDELDRGFEMRPRGQEHDRKIGMLRADVAEELDALLARRRVGREVHVLDDEVDVLVLEKLQAVLGRVRHARLNLAQREHELERGADRVVVVDHEDRAHGLVVSS